MAQLEVASAEMTATVDGLEGKVTGLEETLEEQQAKLKELLIWSDQRKAEDEAFQAQLREIQVLLISKFCAS